MISELLVALDGSMLSLRALEVAGAYADRLGIPLTPVTVVGRKVDAGPDVLWLDQHTADGGVVVPSDDVVGSLLDLAAEEPGTVLCMTSHGRTGLTEVVLGSVSAAVVKRSPDPVLLIGPHAEAPTDFSVVDLCAGADEDATRLEGPAQEWAAALGAEECRVTADDGAVDHPALLVASDPGKHLVRTSRRPVLLVGPSVVDRDWADARTFAR